MLVFITVCECGYNRQQLMAAKVVLVVVKNKYQLHFTTICTAASGPQTPRHYCALNSSSSFLENETQIKEMSAEVTLNVWELPKEVSKVNEA